MRIIRHVSIEVLRDDGVVDVNAGYALRKLLSEAVSTHIFTYGGGSDSPMTYSTTGGSTKASIGLWHLRAGEAD